MKNSLMKILALTMAAAMALTACAGRHDPDPVTDPLPEAGEINISLGAGPATLDPALCSTSEEFSYVGHLFEGLTAVAADGTVSGAAAAEWTVEENELGLPVYTFTLRDGLKWSDGQALTASDFVFAWRRALDPATGSPFAYLLTVIRNGSAVSSGEKTGEELGVEAVDEKTLKVTLEGACPYFTLLTSMPVYFPLREDKVTADPTSWSVSPSTCIGNGAYTLVSWTRDSLLTLAKSASYRGAADVSIDKLNFYMKSDAEGMYLSYEAGALQYAADFPDHLYDELKADGRVAESPLAESYYYIMNTKSGALADPLVRKALMIAVDRSALEVVGKSAAMSAVPEGMTSVGQKEPFTGKAKDYADSVIVDHEAAVTQAKALLEQAGYPGGAGLPAITLIVNDTEAHTSIANAIAAGWLEELGVKVTVEVLPYEEFTSHRASGNFDIARGGAVADFSDPASVLELFISGLSANWYGSEEYDTLIKSSMAETDPAAREAMLSDAEYLLMSDAVVIPLLQSRSVVLCSYALSGVTVSPLGVVSFAAASIAG